MPMFDALINPRTDSFTADLSSPPRSTSASTPLAPVRVQDTSVAERTSAAQDKCQEEVMAITSTDGRPPPTRQRKLEWRWFGVGALVVIAGIICWIVFNGISLAVVITAIVLAVLLLASASPVLAAGLLRGKEQRTARRIVRGERRGGGHR